MRAVRNEKFARSPDGLTVLGDALVPLFVVVSSHLRGRFLSLTENCTVFRAKPFSHFLRVEPDRSAHMKTWKHTSRRHAIDVLVVHSEKFREFGDLHGTLARLQLLNEIHARDPNQAFAATSKLDFAEFCRIAFGPLGFLPLRFSAA